MSKTPPNFFTLKLTLKFNYLAKKEVKMNSLSFTYDDGEGLIVAEVTENYRLVIKKTDYQGLPEQYSTDIEIEDSKDFLRRLEFLIKTTEVLRNGN